ncbi:hypothetical protein, partial [Stenotrophomonas maltophilia]|uniref:hypothetical protein n=1 Tax=Stenotrophomonas maltophilia TaxID=40324 RepID=UPI0013DD3FA0
LRSMWWVHPRPLVDAAFVIDVLGSENMVDEVLRLAHLANGDGTSVYGKPVRIDIQYVIRC